MCIGFSHLSSLFGSLSDAVFFSFWFLGAEVALQHWNVGQKAVKAPCLAMHSLPTGPQHGFLPIKRSWGPFLPSKK